MDTTKDDDCLFFQKMADHGHYGKVENNSRQGTYVFTAQGKFLASINDLSADRMLEMMQSGLKKWDALPAAEKASTSAPKLEPKNRWEDRYPRDGLVLTSYSRDIAKKATPQSEQLPTWNRDSAWFSKSEMESMIPADTKVGAAFSFSDLFVSRLCRMHLVDLVKGQTEAFDVNEIVGSKISGKVNEKKGDQLFIEISGSTQAEHKGSREARGMETKIMGSAVFDVKAKRFTKFEMTAMGERWGRTRFNDRRRQMERTPVGFTFEMAEPDATPIIPGIVWEYDPEWIRTN